MLNAIRKSTRLVSIAVVGRMMRGKYVLEIMFELDTSEFALTEKVLLKNCHGSMAA